MIIYAIIITHNGSKWIDRCFNSLVNSSIPVKILVIDNASTDDTPHIIRNKFPMVELIEAGQNLGFGKANNIGLKRVLNENAEFAFLMNQDAWVEKDTIEKLVESHRKDSEFGILCPVEYYKPGILDLKFEKFYAPKELLSSLKKDNSIIHQTNFTNAAAWLISLETISSIGGFDTVFSHYGEDVDYCNRLKFNNLKIGIVSNANYFHDRPQLLIKESSLERQIAHNHIKRMLYFRWGTEHVVKKLLFIIKEYLTEFIRMKKHYKKESASNFQFFLYNIIRIKKSKIKVLL